MLAPGRATGRLDSGDRLLMWDLEFTNQAPSIPLVPRTLRVLKAASTQVVFAAPDARFRGTVECDGESLRFEGDPGSQTHLWGTRHAERWSWAHCSAFPGHDGCLFEGVAASLPRAAVLGPLTGVYLRYRGEDHFLNGLSQLVRNRSTWVFPAWRFEGASRGLRFIAHLQASPERAAGPLRRPRRDGVPLREQRDCRSRTGCSGR